MSLSPDGRHVVFDLGEKHGEKRDIYLLDTDGGRQVALIDHPADDSVPYWAPDGKRIVFVSDRSGSPGIWMLDVEDGKPKGTPVLVKHVGYHTRLMGFTRDGSLYYEVEGSWADIYAATLDLEAGKVLAPATKMSLPFAGWNYAPFWSPDGKYLAYLSRRVRPEVLVIRSVETGEERELAPAIERLLAPHWYAAPQWSPDGRSILVTGQVKGGNGLYLVDVQTGDFTAIVQQESSERISAPKWPVYSKDGKRIYYVRNRSIFAHDLEANGEKELYRATDDILWLARSPDGAQLAFFEKAESLHRPNVVKTVPASGGDSRELLRLPEGRAFCRNNGLAWTPDGRHVVAVEMTAPKSGGGHVEPDELWSIPVEGGEPRRLELGLNMLHLRLRSDGKSIAFTSLETKGSGGGLFVMEDFLPEFVASR